LLTTTGMNTQQSLTLTTQFYSLDGTFV